MARACDLLVAGGGPAGAAVRGYVAPRTDFVREGIELLVGAGTAHSWRSLARLPLHDRTWSVASGQSSIARAE